MYTIPRKKIRMARKKPEGRVVNFQFKMYGELAERWLEIRERARKKNPFMDDSGFNRRLLGFDSDIKAAVEAVPERDRQHFLATPLGGRRVELEGRTKGKVHLSEVSSNTKRK